MDFDASVYLVTDQPACKGRDLLEVVRAAVQGGVTMVQLREKDLSSREFVELARALKSILAPKAVPLLINDRVDVALAAKADGVHIGQTDMFYLDARALLSHSKIVGLSIDTPEQLAEAQTWDVDYLGIGPVYATATKADAGDPIGLEGIRLAAKNSRHRFVGIGAITAHNAAEVIRAGAHGVAVVSEICSAENPEYAARNLAAVVRRAQQDAG